MNVLPPNFWIRSIFYLLILFIIGFVFYALNILIIPITLGFLLAFLIEPIIGRLESYDMNRIASIGVVFFILITTMMVTLIILVPRAIDEVKDFQQNQARYYEIAWEKYEMVKIKVEGSFPKVVPWEKIEEKFTNNSTEKSASMMSKIFKTVAKSAESAFSFIIIIPLVAFFTLKDGHSLKKWLIQFVPNKYFELTNEVLHNINHQTGAFLRGQIMDSTLNALMVSFFLFLIGLPYYIFVGVFAGIANAIPFVGPITAGAIGILVSILTGASNPLAVIAVFGGAHLIDVMFIYPKTVGHSLNLHELVVILGIIIGGHLGGVIGMLIIIPLIGILFSTSQIMFRLLKGYHII